MVGHIFVAIFLARSPRLHLMLRVRDGKKTPQTFPLPGPWSPLKRWKNHQQRQIQSPKDVHKWISPIQDYLESLGQLIYTLESNHQDNLCYLAFNKLICSYGWVTLWKSITSGISDEATLFFPHGRSGPEKVSSINPSDDRFIGVFLQRSKLVREGHHTFNNRNPYLKVKINGTDTKR